MSLTGPLVLSAWLAAPEPRPPQPISAMRMVSLGEIAPCAKRSTASVLSSAVPAMALDEFLRNCRRENSLGDNGFMLICTLAFQTIRRVRYSVCWRFVYDV